ncbi:hypothetical protein KSD_55770 [Ktedonobacter sp. SOSP1-85]|uniref:hypothetical protein n=1 Tax=Ktedonobacter sp. SOSP1-85 TaxID=2778367 RepID=UPI00191556DC|nr:hypothetical protein [Ktedonobacter sp. SOSP1-85]GHO77806.1 hypothetical protein KSD_55770 [Ktedonobacter sp. SOSP1-85]
MVIGLKQVATLGLIAGSLTSDLRLIPSISIPLLCLPLCAMLFSLSVPFFDSRSHTIAVDGTAEITPSCE